MEEHCAVSVFVVRTARGTVSDVTLFNHIADHLCRFDRAFIVKREGRAVGYACAVGFEKREHDGRPGKSMIDKVITFGNRPTLAVIILAQRGTHFQKIVPSPAVFDYILRQFFLRMILVPCGNRRNGVLFVEVRDHPVGRPRQEVLGAVIILLPHFPRLLHKLRLKLGIPFCFQADIRFQIQEIFT